MCVCGREYSIFKDNNLLVARTALDQRVFRFRQDLYELCRHFLSQLLPQVEKVGRGWRPYEIRSHVKGQFPSRDFHPRRLLPLLPQKSLAISAVTITRTHRAADGSGTAAPLQTPPPAMLPRLPSKLTSYNLATHSPKRLHLSFSDAATIATTSTDFWGTVLDDSRAHRTSTVPQMTIFAPMQPAAAAAAPPH